MTSPWPANEKDRKCKTGVAIVGTTLTGGEGWSAPAPSLGGAPEVSARLATPTPAVAGPVVPAWVLPGWVLPALVAAGGVVTGVVVPGWVVTTVVLTGVLPEGGAEDRCTCTPLPCALPWPCTDPVGVVLVVWVVFVVAPAAGCDCPVACWLEPAGTAEEPLAWPRPAPGSPVGGGRVAVEVWWDGLWGNGARMRGMNGGPPLSTDWFRCERRWITRGVTPL